MKIAETYYGLDDFLASQAGSSGAPEGLVRQVVEYVEEKKLDPDTVEISLGEEGDVQVTTFSLGLNRFSEAPQDQIKEEELLTFVALAQDNIELHEALERVIRLDVQGASENLVREALHDLDQRLARVETRGDEDSQALCAQIRLLRGDPHYAKASGLADRYGKIAAEEGSQSGVNTRLALDLWNMGFLSRPDLEKLGFQEVIDSKESRMELPKNAVVLEGSLAEALLHFKEYIRTHRLDENHLGYALDTGNGSLTVGTSKLVDYYRPSFKLGLLDAAERKDIAGTFVGSLPVGILESGFGVAKYLFKDLPTYAWRKIFGDEKDPLGRHRLSQAEGKVAHPYKMGRAIFEAGALEFVKGVGDDFSRRWEAGGLRDRSEILGMITSMALPLGYLGVAKGVAVVGKAKNLLPFLKAQKILSVQTGMKVAKTLVKAGVRAVVEFSPLGDFQVLVLLTKRFGAVVLEVPMAIVREGSAAVSNYVKNILDQLPTLELATPEGVRLPLAMAMSEAKGGNGGQKGEWDTPTQRLRVEERVADAEADTVPEMQRKLPDPIEWEIPVRADGTLTGKFTWSGETLAWLQSSGITISHFVPDASAWRELRGALDTFLEEGLTDPLKIGFSGIVDPAFLRLYREIKAHSGVMQNFHREIHVITDPVFAQRVDFFEKYLLPWEVLPPTLTALPESLVDLQSLDEILTREVLSRYQEIPKSVRRIVTDLIGEINARQQQLKVKADEEAMAEGAVGEARAHAETPEPAARRTTTPPPGALGLKDVPARADPTSPPAAGRKPEIDEDPTRSWGQDEFKKPLPPSRSPGELTMAMDRAGLDSAAQNVVRKAVKKRVAKGTKRARNVAIGAAVVGGGAAVWGLTRRNGSGTLKIDEASLANLTLSEKTLKGLQTTIGNLEKQLEGIAPTQATPAEGDGVRIETLVQEMYEAKIYSTFIQLREKGMAEKRAITLDDLEKLLNENGVTDLGVRLRFYQLALKYFERVKKIEEKSKQLQEVTKAGKIDPKSVKAFIEKEFGFTPQGKVEFIVRDIHIATIFHDDEDYIKATSPHDSLWEKDPKDYNAEEKAIYKGIRDYALAAGGMSFGEGLTIQRSYGKGEDKKILEHEEGHELVSIGPYFLPRENPWKIWWKTMGDIDALLESVFWRKGIRSLHNEMISYFREPEEFRKSNPFYEGSKLYDPKVTRNLREVLWEKVGRDSSRFKEAEAKLDRVHRQFFERVHQTYNKLREIALRFEKNPELVKKYKPRIVAWLSIRGDRPWDADLLKYIEYDQEVQGKPKPQPPPPEPKQEKAKPALKPKPVPKPELKVEPKVEPAAEPQEKTPPPKKPFNPFWD